MGWGVIGTVPQTPLPPLITFFTRRSTVVSAAGLYLAATSLYAGPMLAPELASLFNLWQVVQSLAAIRSKPLSEAVLAGAVAGAAAVVSWAGAVFVSLLLPQAPSRRAEERTATNCLLKCMVEFLVGFRGTSSEIFCVLLMVDVIILGPARRD